MKKEKIQNKTINLLNNKSEKLKIRLFSNIKKISMKDCWELLHQSLLIFIINLCFILTNSKI